MHALKIFEKYIPYLLPFLLIFFRGLADLTVLLIGIIFLYRSYKDSNWLWANEKWFKFSLIFVLYLLIINSSLSINPKDSIFYAITFLRWPIFALALYFWIFKSDDAINKFIVSLTAVLFFIIFDVWYQFISGEDILGYQKYSPERLTGPLRNNPVVGIFMTKYLYIVLTSLIILNVFNKKSLRTISFISLILLGFISVLISGERMSFILFTSSIFIVIAGMGRSNIERIYILLITIFLLLGSLAIIHITYPLVFERAINSVVYKLQNFTDSDYGMVFRTAYHVWLQNPLFGGGLHQFKELPSLYGINIWEGAKIFHPHNHPLSLLAETGIIGLVLFYTVIIQIFKQALSPVINKKEWFRLALLFNLLYVCFFPFMTHFSFQHNWMNATNWLIVGFVLAIAKKYE
ncbi:MAG: O-antigen ligase family protein [Methylophilaceae bacterium]|nr:O-antigen ligase family protein [Methylophilaceae bacterium]